MPETPKSPVAPTTQPEPEPTELELIGQALKSLGYAKLKQGACNIPGYRNVQTWGKRSGQVYVVFNEAGQWDLLTSAFPGEPNVEGIARALIV